MVYVISVHMGCHIQGLKHGFSTLVKAKDRQSTIVDIDCPKPGEVDKLKMLKKLLSSRWYHSFIGISMLLTWRRGKKMILARLRPRCHVSLAKKLHSSINQYIKGIHCPIFCCSCENLCRKVFLIVQYNNKMSGCRPEVLNQLFGQLFFL